MTKIKFETEKMIVSMGGSHMFSEDDFLPEKFLYVIFHRELNIYPVIQ